MACLKFVGKTDTIKYKDMDSFSDLINYITNPAKATSLGFANVSSLEAAAAEMEAVFMQGRKSSGKKIHHIVINFSDKERQRISQTTMDDIANKCLQYFATHYQAVCATHSRPQEHIHRVSLVDFRRYPDRYEDRDRFWRYLYQILACYNIRLWKN